MQFFTTALALGALCISTVSAGYCEFFYDSKCKNSANSGTAFSCLNTNAVGSGGQYMKCHAGHADNNWCYVYGVPSQSAKPTSADKLQGPIAMLETPDCLDLGRKGPWYVLTESPVN